MDESGQMVAADKFDFKGHENLQKFTNYEISKAKAMGDTWRMRQRELLDKEPGPGSQQHAPLLQWQADRSSLK